MSQPPPTPPTVDYLAPRDAQFPLHKRSARHARGNGTGCIVLSFCVGAAASGPLMRPPAAGGAAALAYFLVAAILLLYAFSYFACGILYLIASFKIRRPNPTWETTLIITAAIHTGIILLLLALGIIGNFASGNFTPAFFFGVLINVLIALSLGQSIQLVRKARTEI